MKRETTMAFLAGVAVTGAFFAGMGATQQASKPRPKIIGFQLDTSSNSGPTPYLMTEDGEVWRTERVFVFPDGHKVVWKMYQGAP